jgi:hypothetical protein
MKKDQHPGEKLKFNSLLDHCHEFWLIQPKLIVI